MKPKKRPSRLQFAPRPKLELHGARLTSGASELVHIARLRRLLLLLLRIVVFGSGIDETPVYVIYEFAFPKPSFLKHLLLLETSLL